MMNNQTLSKSDFHKYLQCETYLWYHKHAPQFLKRKPIDPFTQHLINQGKIVEEWVYKRFPGAYRVKSKGTEAVLETQELVKKHGMPLTIIQAALEADGLFTQYDILRYKEDGSVSIYEIKSSSSKRSDGRGSKTEHLWDAAFQVEVAKRAGLKIHSVYLNTINANYTLESDFIDPDYLINQDDITLEIDSMKEEIHQEVNLMRMIVDQRNMPTSCDCLYKSRKNQCPTFEHLYPGLNGYTVHELTGIRSGSKLLSNLINDQVFHIEDVPNGYNLSEKMENQVYVQKYREAIVRPKQIRQFLDNLVYPLYYLDYETASFAVPQYNGTKPYQQIPFQYSLHIQQEPGGPVEHREFIHTNKKNPIPFLLHQLRRDIGPNGMIISWNMGFEKRVNNFMASGMPQYEQFLTNINDRMYDLMYVFSKQMVVHKGFKGSASLKRVLPVISPDLSYNSLVINNGELASLTWIDLIIHEKNLDQKEEIIQDLLDYCRMDTYAMVKILAQVYLMV